MESEHYKGYMLWGHSIAHPADPEQSGYAVSGTVTRDGILVAASDVLEVVTESDTAQHLGIEWARAWVDMNS